MQSAHPSELEAWFAANRERIGALIGEAMLSLRVESWWMAMTYVQSLTRYGAQSSRGTLPPCANLSTLSVCGFPWSLRPKFIRIRC